MDNIADSLSKPIPQPIRGFQGEFRFLSNFWPAPIVMGTLVFPTSEHAYQAAKSLNWEDWKDISECVSPGAAKRLGKKLEMRPDWDQIKIRIMGEITRAKYEQNPDLKQKLLATAPRELREDNHCGDIFWGVCRGRGHNHLGRILMAYRDGFLSKYIEENS